MLYVVAPNMLYVDIFMFLYYGKTFFSCDPVKDFSVLFHILQLFQSFFCPYGEKKNGTFNTGNTNLLVNLAEKQIVLHNRKLSCTKGPLYCITALATCFIKTLAMHFFYCSSTPWRNVNTQHKWGRERRAIV